MTTLREVKHEVVDARYVAMCTAIAECAAIDEVKDLRDKAVALEVYAKQAQNFDAERQAQEVRVRAERRAGELLKAMTKARGGQPYQATGQSTGPVGQTLADHGITKNQSSQWQQLADVPQAQRIFDDAA
ncbi:hypothetical protein [Paraburkholderia sp. MM5477-R1]|uniref:hypothetical protein n=1 Tax=Paraburkholderia sp. MM5477-R1 TaxID=2991062 RepID=UPI003D233CE3